jgi:2,3-bisphosphoglycerate-independent phosphoglycerate mutase
MNFKHSKPNFRSKLRYQIDANLEGKNSRTHNKKLEHLLKKAKIILENHDINKSIWLECHKDDLINKFWKVQ